MRIKPYVLIYLLVLSFLQLHDQKSETGSWKMQSWGILKTSELSWKACVTLKLPMVSLRMLCYRSWIKTVCECGSLDVRDLCAMVCLSGSPEASLQGAVAASWDRWLSSRASRGSVLPPSLCFWEKHGIQIYFKCATSSLKNAWK